MQKRIIPQAETSALAEDGKWLDLEPIAEVEVTSEDPAHPIEAALLSDGTAGWRATEPGEQQVRIKFHPPQQIRRMLLEFSEKTAKRTQEFVLCWRAEGGRSFQEIVRQQWNFSPQGATHEIEDYRVELFNASIVELTITPDIGGGDARASLGRWRFSS